MRLDHLLQAGLFGGDHVIGQEDGEGFIAQKTARAPDGVAKTLRLLLAHIGDGAGIHVGFLQKLQKVLLALPLQLCLDHGGVVEIILKRRLPARGHEDEFLDPGGARLVDGVLDQRAIDERHDLLRDRLGRREEPRPKTCNRENGLRDFPLHLYTVSLIPRAAAMRAAGSAVSFNFCAPNGTTL